MAIHAFRIVNVFTQGESPLTGNPLCVFEDGADFDDATGSATANFGGWCLAMQQPLPLRYEISQGEMTGRPSTLYLEVASDRHIRVSGDVVDLGSGTVTLR
jgi:predicted PhzF superfamily epimerase YddE/YHI9